MSGVVLLAAVLRGAMWAFPLILGAYYRRPQTVGVALLYVGANVAAALGERELAGLLAMPAAGGAAYLLCDRALRVPSVIERRWRADQANSSRERHDLRNQLAVLAAENAVLSSKLKEER